MCMQAWSSEADLHVEGCHGIYTGRGPCACYSRDELRQHECSLHEQSRALKSTWVERCRNEQYARVKHIREEGMISAQAYTDQA